MGPSPWSTAGMMGTMVLLKTSSKIVVRGAGFRSRFFMADSVSKRRGRLTIGVLGRIMKENFVWRAGHEP